MSKKDISCFDLKKLILAHHQKNEETRRKNLEKEKEFQKNTEEILKKIHDNQKSIQR